MSKYIDLLTDITEDTARTSFADQASIHSALTWLDEHPDQVPGQTITLGEVRSDPHYVTGDYQNGYVNGFVAAGGRVIPDPVPTNAEKLEQIIMRVDADRRGGYETFAGALDAAGVKAPGVES